MEDGGSFVGGSFDGQSYSGLLIGVEAKHAIKEDQDSSSAVGVCCLPYRAIKE